MTGGRAAAPSALQPGAGPGSIRLAFGAQGAPSGGEPRRPRRPRRQREDRQCPARTRRVEAPGQPAGRQRILPSCCAPAWLANDLAAPLFLHMPADASCAPPALQVRLKCTPALRGAMRTTGKIRRRGRRQSHHNRHHQQHRVPYRRALGDRRRPQEAGRGADEPHGRPEQGRLRRGAGRGRRVRTGRPAGQSCGRDEASHRKRGNVRVSALAPIEPDVMRRQSRAAPRRPGEAP